MGFGRVNYILVNSSSHRNIEKTAGPHSNLRSFGVKLA